MKLRRYKINFFMSLVLALGGMVWVVATNKTPQLGLDLEGGISVTLTAVSDESIQPGVLEKTVEIIRERVDQLGGLEPEVSRAGADNILIQLPGIENEEEALSVIGTTAQLTFRQVEEIIPSDGSDEPTPTPTPSPTDPKSDDSGGKGGKNADDRKKDDPKKDEPKKDEPKPEESPSSDRPEVTEETDESVNDEEVVYPSGQDGEEGTLYRLKPAVLTGDVVTDAEAVVDTQTGAWSVSIDMNKAAAKTWADFTGRLACIRDEGDPIREQVAIVLDGKVESAAGMRPPDPGNPGSGIVCNEGISGGQTEITVGGDEDAETEAKNLALVLQTGALPLTLEQSEVQKVSPTLGKDSLQGGLLAGIIGLILVMLYMVVYYRALGLVVWLGLAVFSSLLYVVIVLLGDAGVLTLSLAGIAGFIVSVGVTADSYIVAFERLKDEVHSGKSLRAAVDRGMVRAFRTILVADFVTAAAAVILFSLAVGSVKGFALTLGIATVIDVLVAYYFTRSAVTLLARSKRFSEGRLLGIKKALGIEAAPA